MFEWLQNPNVDFSPEAWKSLFREGSVISALINTVRRRLMRLSKKSSSPFMDRVSLPGSESSRKLNAKTFTQALRHCTHSDPSSPSIMKKKPRERWHPFKHDTDNISCTCRKPEHTAHLPRSVFVKMRECPEMRMSSVMSWFSALGFQGCFEWVCGVYGSKVTSNGCCEKSWKSPLNLISCKELSKIKSFFENI